MGAADRIDPAALTSWKLAILRELLVVDTEATGWGLDPRMMVALEARDFRLPADALVARGGESALRSLRSNAIKTHKETGWWAVSGAAGVDVDLPTLMAVYPMPNTSVRTTSADALRLRGFEVVLSRGPGHCSIILPLKPSDGPPGDAMLERLASTFGPCVPNPNPET